ncbi:MAG: signal recognition particle protein [Firmicutes bacterium]|nr:signal recognition particle protein [Bacillota bacterium]
MEAEGVFSSLSERLQDIFRRLRGKGRLSEADVDAALREVRLALLEADVNYLVVKDFIARVRARAVGQEILESLTPGQHVIKIVHEELTALMGKTEAGLARASEPPGAIMLVGLQGSGKTTTAGKLGLHLRKGGKGVMLVAADVRRPAAVRQLQVVGEGIGLPVFAAAEEDPVAICAAGVAEARRRGLDYVLLDTAGRLHVDDELMAELERIKAAVRPVEILLVADAMTGQDAVNVAKAFHERLGLTGVILTKLDSDTRGGAALSIRAVTGAAIKFAGTGEKIEQFEVFHPDRIAARILGMGDVLSLIEQAQRAVDQKKAQAVLDHLRKDEYTLEDFLTQLQEMRKMGPFDQLLAMLPGVAGRDLKNLRVDEKEFGRLEAIIRSMTPGERRNPQIIDGSRRRRIARGSGTTVQQVNRLLQQFEESRRLMRQLTEGARSGRRPRFPFGL